MSQLLIHPKTSQQVESFKTNPSHALLIVGSSGIGKRSLASNLAESILELEPGKFHQYGYFKKITPVDKKAIGIDNIRELEHFLSLKVPVNKVYNRAVIIEDSHNLTLEAQNALLKLLEEPPAGTILILTTNDAQALLPTIRSRAQVINLTKPDEKQTKDYFSRLQFTDQEIKQAYSISGGLPGLMNSMLSSDEHALTPATEWARKLLSQTAYERLLSVDELAKQRDLATDITFILKQMAHVSLQATTGKTASKWHKILKASYEANESLSTNANTKLTLTKLMLSL